MKGTKKKAIRLIPFFFFLIIAVLSGRQAYRIYAEKQSGKDAYTDLEQYVRLPSEPPARSDVPARPDLPSRPKPPARPDLPDEEPEQSEPEDIPASIFPEIDFDALADVNSQVVGWIYCEDTVINYPIAQAEDNDYYLHHLFDGTYNSTGCIFLDCRNSSDFTDPHSIIYGHHLRSGNMFAGLMDYKDQAYYEAHPQFLLMTPSRNYIVDIFAGYVANVADEAWRMDFGTEDEYASWLKESIEKSCIRSEVVPTTADRILTLSTCSYEFNNARFVLLGILRGE